MSEERMIQELLEAFNHVLEEQPEIKVGLESKYSFLKMWDGGKSTS